MSHRRVLVLTRDWQPVRVVSWEHAMSWICAGKAEVIEESQTDIVRSAHAEWAVPSVVRVKTGVIPERGRVMRFSRRGVYARDDGHCQYCGCHVPYREMTLDHVQPSSKGGGTTWTNVVLCCRPCNQVKGNRTPDQARMTLINHPRKPTFRSLIERDLLEGDGRVPEEWRNYIES
jgi:5-methylcytosine-specific restriction endonuclease McrA